MMAFGLEVSLLGFQRRSWSSARPAPGSAAASSPSAASRGCISSARPIDQAASGGRSCAADSRRLFGAVAYERETSILAFGRPAVPVGSCVRPPVASRCSFSLRTEQPAGFAVLRDAHCEWLP